MASNSLSSFATALDEVADLGRADPTAVGTPPVQPELTRVVGRASVVLLSSHFERYVYSINEEAARILNSTGVLGDVLPESVRLLHSRPSIDAMVETGWDRRTTKLQAFVQTEGWLWGEHRAGALDHERLLLWMKAPSPWNLVRYYRYWGITDIFSAITRAPHTRTDLWLKIDELVRKRNNIAHGDATTEATRSDVRVYRASAMRFCERADRQLARALRPVIGGPPW